jgi:hypothetical protein
MARIFTINFTYEGETYNTMISVKTTPYYMEYTLSNLDFELKFQLPGNKIISPSPKSFFFPNATPQHSTELMNTIINAMKVHLQAFTPLSTGGKDGY